MKTVFVGGGRGCVDVLQFIEQGRLNRLGIEVLAVVDMDPDAPAMRFAQERGWPTLERMSDGFALPDLELVIELTGSDKVLGQVHRHVPPGVKVIDHQMARVFWDLDKVERELRQELITRTELQKEIAEDRAQLQNILDALSGLIVVLDSEERIVHVNHRFERITGKRRREVLGRTVREALEGSDADDWAEELAGAFAEVTGAGQLASMVCAKTLRDGQRCHFHVKANPIFDENLEIVRVVISAREITELVMLKRETEDSARRFQQIIDAVHGLVTIKDLEGRYIVVNPWTEKVVGIPRDEMIGKKAADLFPKEAADRIQQLDQETLERGGRHVSEEIITVGTVDRILVSERLPLTDYKGDVVGVCCVSQDQTRRRQLQQELIQTERLAAIGKLAAGVAHEVNNPLSGILTFAQDLHLEAAPDDPKRQDYELIVNETLRCRRIVRNLLEFSKPKTLKREHVSMKDLLARALPMVERQASFHDVEFEVSLAEDLPALHVDPQQLQQVLLNLVINARDAMDAKGRVRIVAEPGDRGRAVVLSVTDEGCGIPDDQVDQIFEPFHSTKGDKGHGLGLTAVRDVVEWHGGWIEVDSSVGVGTTFRITLPAAWE